MRLLLLVVLVSVTSSMKVKVVFLAMDTVPDEVITPNSNMGQKMSVSMCATKCVDTREFDCYGFTHHSGNGSCILHDYLRQIVPGRMPGIKYYQRILPVEGIWENVVEECPAGSFRKDYETAFRGINTHNCIANVTRPSNDSFPINGAPAVINKHSPQEDTLVDTNIYRTIDIWCNSWLYLFIDSNNSVRYRIFWKPLNLIKRLFCVNEHYYLLERDDMKLGKLQAFACANYKADNNCSEPYKFFGDHCWKIINASFHCENSMFENLAYFRTHAELKIIESVFPTFNDIEVKVGINLDNENRFGSWIYNGEYTYNAIGSNVWKSDSSRPAKGCTVVIHRTQFLCASEPPSYALCRRY